MRRSMVLFVSAFFLFHLPVPSPCSGAETPPPKLILQITIDGLRGDMPGRYLHRLGDGGFRWLMENGVVYGDAHYRHSNTETIVGHTILATGANPAASGMVANVWFDRVTGALAYNIEDPTCEILTAGAGVQKETEIDPTQKVAKVTGRSASNILTTTFGGELIETYFHPYLYLKREVITGKGFDQREVEEAVAAELMKFDGIALALSSTALREGGVPNAPLVEQIRSNFHPKRSGDIYVVQEPYWFLYEEDRLCAMHGSPWRYDTFVPVVFAGAGLGGRKWPGLFSPPTSRRHSRRYSASNHPRGPSELLSPRSSPAVETRVGC